MEISAAQRHFTTRRVYLNTAAVGLPPTTVTDAVEQTVRAWSRGEVSAADFDAAVESNRARYARLVGVSAERVAIGSQASQLLGLVAANLPSGSEVLIAQGDFTSVTFPFLAQQKRGVRVREVPLGAIASAVTPDTTLVACSLVQSADGAVLDASALVGACERHGARTAIDITQAAGWMRVDAARFDVTVCSGYKWLLAPRGTAFLTIGADLRSSLVVHSASWYGGQDRWESIYGSPLRLSQDARGLDVSPAWFSWVGQDAALEFIEQVGIARIGRHNMALAARVRDALGLPASPSAIVSLALDDAQRRRLDDADVAYSVRDGRVRLSFHMHNTDGEVDLLLNALRVD